MADTKEVRGAELLSGLILMNLAWVRALDRSGVIGLSDVLNFAKEELSHESITCGEKVVLENFIQGIDKILNAKNGFKPKLSIVHPDDSKE